MLFVRAACYPYAAQPREAVSSIQNHLDLTITENQNSLAATLFVYWIIAVPLLLLYYCFCFRNRGNDANNSQNRKPYTVSMVNFRQTTSGGVKLLCCHLEQKTDEDDVESVEMTPPPTTDTDAVPSAMPIVIYPRQIGGSLDQQHENQPVVF